MNLNERKRKICLKEKLDEFCNLDEPRTCKKSPIGFKPNFKDLYDPITVNNSQAKQYRKYLLQLIL